MEPSFNPYARGPPAGATFVPFAPQQTVGQSPQTFMVPQASQQAAPTVDPFTLEPLRAPSAGFNQPAFQPSFAASFAPVTQGVSQQQSFAPATSNYGTQQSHFAAFAPPVPAPQAMSSFNPGPATSAPNFSPFVMSQPAPSPQQVVQAQASLASPTGKPSTYLTPPETLSRGVAGPQASHQPQFSSIAPASAPQQQFAFAPAAQSSQSAQQPSFFMPQQQQQAVQRQQSFSGASPQGTPVFLPQQVPQQMQQASAPTFNAFAPQTPAPTNFTPNFQQQPQQPSFGGAAQLTAQNPHPASFFPANDEFSTPSFQPSFAPAASAQMVAPPMNGSSYVIPSNNPAVARQSSTTSFIAAPSTRTSVYLTPPDQMVKKPAAHQMPHQAAHPPFIAVTPQTPSTAVVVHVPDPNQQAVIMQQQAQLQAMQAQMAQQQQMLETALKQQQQQQEAAQKAAQEAQRKEQQRQQEEAHQREQQRKQQEAAFKEQQRLAQEAAFKEQQRVAAETALREQQKLVEQQRQMQETAMRQQLAMQEAAVREQQRLAQEAGQKEQQRQVQDAALKQQQLAQAFFMQQQQQTGIAQAPRFSPQAPSFVPGQPAPQPVPVMVAAPHNPHLTPPMTAPASADLGLAKPPSATHGRERRTVARTDSMRTNIPNQAEVPVNIQNRPPAPTYAPQPMVAALAAESQPQPVQNRSIASQPSFTPSSLPVAQDDFAPRSSGPVMPVSNLNAIPQPPAATSAVVFTAPALAPKASTAAPSFGSPASGLVFAADDEFGSSALDLNAKPAQPVSPQVSTPVPTATAAAPPSPPAEIEKAGEVKLAAPKPSMRKRGETKKDLRPYEPPAYASPVISGTTTIDAVIERQRTLLSLFELATEKPAHTPAPAANTSLVAPAASLVMAPAVSSGPSNPFAVPGVIYSSPPASQPASDPVPPAVSRATKPASPNTSSTNMMPAPLPDSTSSSALNAPPPVSRDTKPKTSPQSAYVSPPPANKPPPVSRDTKPKAQAEGIKPSFESEIASFTETVELLAEMLACWNPKEPIGKNEIIQDLVRTLREVVMPGVQNRISMGNTAMEYFNINDQGHKLLLHYDSLSRGIAIIPETSPRSAAVASAAPTVDNSAKAAAAAAGIAAAQAEKEKQEKHEKAVRDARERDNARKEKEKEKEKEKLEKARQKEVDEERIRQLALQSIDAEMAKSAFPSSGDDEFGQGAFVIPSANTAAPAAKYSSPIKEAPLHVVSPASGALPAPHSSSNAERRRTKRQETTMKAAASSASMRGADGGNDDVVPYYAVPSIKAAAAAAVGKTATMGAVERALERGRKSDDGFKTPNPAAAPVFNTALYNQDKGDSSDEDVAGDHFDSQPRPKVTMGKEVVVPKPPGVDQVRQQLQAQEMEQRRVAQAEEEERKRRQRRIDEEEEIKREIEKSRREKDKKQVAPVAVAVATTTTTAPAALASSGSATQGKLAEAKLRLEESKRKLDDARRIADLPPEIVSLFTTAPARAPPLPGQQKPKLEEADSALADLADLEGELQAEKEERLKDTDVDAEKGARHLRRLSRLEQGAQADPQPQGILKKRNTLILNQPAPVIVPVQPVVAPAASAGFSQPPQQVQWADPGVFNDGSLRNNRRATLTKPPELSLPAGVKPLVLDNTLSYTVDDSGQLPAAKAAPPAVPPRDEDGADDVEIISEERVEPTEMQRMGSSETSPRDGDGKPAAFYEEAKAAFSKTFSPRPEKLKHFKVHPAMELMKGEEAYVEDLRVAVEEYINPLRKAAQEKKEILKDDQIAACFPLIEALYNHHAKLLGDLKFRGKDYWDNGKANKPPYLGEWFLSLRDVPGFFFDMYVSYAKGFADQWNAFTTNKKKNSKFASFLKAKEGKIKPISSILSTPFQRVSQYVSLADAIRRDYPSYYPTDNWRDFEALQLGCIGVREIKLGINDFNHDKEVMQLAQVLTPKPKDFVHCDRRFKRETEVNEWEAGTLKPRTLIFLSDAVMSVKKKNAETYHMKSLCLLKTAQIEGDPKFDFKEWNFPPVVEKMVARAILINSREKTVLVFFPSLEVKMVWKTLLDTTAQKRRAEKPSNIKISSTSPAARNASPNYGLLTQVPVDSWFPKENRGESSA